jgi:hypothetical protein
LGRKAQPRPEREAREVTVAEQINLLAVFNGDVEPLTGLAAKRAFTEQNYLSFLRRAEEALLMRLPVDALTGVVYHHVGSYDARVGTLPTASLNPDFRRMCEDGVRTHGKPATMLTAESRSWVDDSNSIWNPYIINAWFLRGDGLLELFPRVAAGGSGTYDLVFDYVRKPKTLIVSGAGGSTETTVSELPEDWHDAMQVRAESFICDALELDELSAQRVREFEAMIGGSRGKVERYAGGASS